MRRLVKLGGSVITRSDTVDLFDADNTSRLATELLESGSGLILVHGTGHVGKPYAVEHEFVDCGFISADRTELTAEIRSELRRLNTSVVNSLCDAGIRAYEVSPESYFSEDMTKFRDPRFICELRQQVQLGGVPVFYGDLMPLSNGASQVFSSDRVTSILARYIKFQQVIFLTDVAGVFGCELSGQRAKRPLRELSASNRDAVFRSESDESDVSGGMQRKIDVALSIATYADECIIASGREKGVLAALLSGQQIDCTRVISEQSST